MKSLELHPQRNFSASSRKQPYTSIFNIFSTFPAPCLVYQATFTFLALLASTGPEFMLARVGQTASEGRKTMGVCAKAKLKSEIPAQGMLICTDASPGAAADKSATRLIKCSNRGSLYRSRRTPSVIDPSSPLQENEIDTCVAKGAELQVGC